MVDYSNNSGNSNNLPLSSVGNNGTNRTIDQEPTIPAVADREQPLAILRRRIRSFLGRIRSQSLANSSSSSSPTPLVHLVININELMMVNDDSFTSFSGSPIVRDTPLNWLNTDAVVSVAAQESLLNPQALTRPLFREYELGRITLTFASPITTGLLALQIAGSGVLLARVPLLALSVGTAFIMMGILLSCPFPDFARPVEEVGIVLVFLAFFGILGTMLPRELAWVPWLSFYMIITALLVLRVVDRYLPGADEE